MTDTFDIRGFVFHLVDAGPIAPTAVRPELWSDRTAPELATGQLLSVFEYDETWNYRERHPVGDELAMVLSGAVDLLLDQGDGERAVPVDAGEASVIPAGAWHRVAIREPATVLFVTPVPARTQHERLT